MILTGLLKRIDRVKFLVDNNSTMLLSAVGVGGTVATAILTGRASFRAAQLIQQEILWAENPDDPTLSPEIKNDHTHRSRIQLTTADKVKLVWQLYIPPVGVGITTITSIVMANKISSKKIAALTIASGISERALKEYKTKVIEKLGARQERAIRDEVAQDRVTGNPSKEVIVVGTGKVLCYDMTTGRYFQSSMEDIKKAVNKVNYEMIHFQYASLSQFYDEIGLSPTSYSDEVGWNMNHLLEVQFSTVMSPDNQPCITIDFTHQPVSHYNNLHD